MHGQRIVKCELEERIQSLSEELQAHSAIQAQAMESEALFFPYSLLALSSPPFSLLALLFLLASTL